VSGTSNNTEPDIDAIVSALGILYPVRLSDTLHEVLKPNEFLSELGIRFDDRLRNMLSTIKEGFVPSNGIPDEKLPETGLIVPFMVTQGPFIREVQFGIKAELQKDDDGRSELFLTVIQDPN